MKECVIQYERRLGLYEQGLMRLGVPRQDVENAVRNLSCELNSCSSVSLEQEREKNNKIANLCGVVYKVAREIKTKSL